ncbi:MAG: sensor histidine kinase [Janthinobacterium lividum]
MKLFPPSLRLQLILWNALTLTALLTVMGIVTRFAAGEAIMSSVDQQLTERAHPPPHGPPRGFGPPGGQLPPPNDPHFFGPFPSWPHFHRPRDPDDSEHQPRFFNLHSQPRDSEPSIPWDKTALDAARLGQPGFSTVTIKGEPYRVLTQSAPPDGFVQVAYPLTEVNRAIAGLDHALLLLIPVALLGAGLGGAGLTARVLRPIRQITGAAAAMGDTPSARLPTQGEDEFAQMADTFNGLLSRLDISFQHQAQVLEQQRRFTADASHELKSPLTVIQGTANQISYGGFSEAEVCQAAAEIAGAAAGMARLVQDLLLLARSDEGRLGQNKISVLVSEILAQAMARTARIGSPITMEIADETLTVSGNEDELIRLFANLLQNASQATLPDGSITISARADGSETVITVTDTGIGIAPEHLAHLGERFYRTDTARARHEGGTGLGLSICRGIADAHQGTLTLTSTPGVRTTATVTLKR